MPVWDDKATFDQFYRSGAERWGHPNTRPQIQLNYHWYPIVQYQTASYAPQLVTVLGINPGDGVILVGCGFNGTGAGLTAAGVNVIGTDISTYIQNEKANTEEAEIRAACVAAGVDPDVDLIIGPSGNADVDPLDLFLEGGRAAPAARGKGEILDQELRTRGSRNAVLNKFEADFPNASIRFIISEELLNSITDAEADLVASYMHDGASEWGSTVVHMLSPLQTGKTQAPELNWKTYAGWRAWLDANGYSSHLILPTVTASGQGMTFPAENPAGVVTAYSGTF